MGERRRCGGLSQLRDGGLVMTQPDGNHRFGESPVSRMVQASAGARGDRAPEQAREHGRGSVVVGR